MRYAVRIYLDNCCYNRPYDDQSQDRVREEAKAKLYIQERIREGSFDLVTSYMLMYENSRNRFETKRNAIRRFVEDNAVIHVDESHKDEAEHIAEDIQATGVKSADSIHTACAIIAKCDYFLTTDDRLLKYKSDRIQIVDPTEFVRLIGGEINDG